MVAQPMLCSASEMQPAGVKAPVPVSRSNRTTAASPPEATYTDRPSGLAVTELGPPRPCTVVAQPMLFSASEMQPAGVKAPVPVSRSNRTTEASSNEVA